MQKTSKTMIFRTFLAAAVALLASFATASAADAPFTMKVGENDSLVITGPDGQVVATLPTATVGKTVDAGPYSFQVSYGRDASGNLSVIVTPNPDHPTPLSFTMGGRVVSTDPISVVTLTLGAGGNVVVDPGATGTVHVDGKTQAVATNSNGTPAVQGMPQGGGTPPATGPTAGTTQVASNNQAQQTTNGGTGVDSGDPLGGGPIAGAGSVFIPTPNSNPVAIDPQAGK